VLKWGHRARLTVVMAGGSGLLLIALLLGAIYGFYVIEVKGAREELSSALTEAQFAVDRNRFEPDFTKAVQKTPELSVALYKAGDKKDGPVQEIGNLDLPLVDDSTFTEIKGVRVLLEAYHFTSPASRVAPAAEYTAVAGVAWRVRQNDLRSFASLLVALWFVLMLIVAFITWTASRSTFEPLERLADQAEAMSAENLAARLDIEPGEYGDFARRLNRFLERIETAVRREERFVGDAAHELRTPLTVMRGSLETTLMRTRTASEYRDSMKQVLEEVARLSGLVEMLLQSASQVEGPVEPLDLESQSEQAHARWVDRYAEHGVTLELTSVPCTAKVKPRELEVVVDNLLSNALKVSTAGDHCELTVVCTSKVAKINVVDEGPGVPPQYAESIFERLTRLDEGRNRDRGGFGIGLAVCRRIVEGRGGKVYLAPSPKGAHFVIELPT
jgi:signal transduction histidine kinase